MWRTCGMIIVRTNVYVLFVCELCIFLMFRAWIKRWLKSWSMTETRIIKMLVALLVCWNNILVVWIEIWCQPRLEDCLLNWSKLSCGENSFTGRSRIHWIWMIMHCLPSEVCTFYSCLVIISFFFLVIYAYDQALLCLGYLPDIWYEAALFQQQAEKALTDKGDVKQSAAINEEITGNI